MTEILDAEVSGCVPVTEVLSPHGASGVDLDPAVFAEFALSQCSIEARVVGDKRTLDGKR